MFGFELKSDIEKVLFSPAEINARVRELAGLISADYLGKQVTVVTVLKGSFFFAADLLKHLTVTRDIDFVSASSYIGTNSSKKIKLVADLSGDPKGKNLLLIEDIADTGYTLEYLQRTFKERGAESVRTCVLLDKPSKRKVDVEIGYKGFTIDDEFVVGYGMDYNEKYRTLPYIGTLRPEVLKNRTETILFTGESAQDYNALSEEA